MKRILLFMFLMMLAIVWSISCSDAGNLDNEADETIGGDADLPQGKAGDDADQGSDISDDSTDSEKGTDDKSDEKGTDEADSENGTDDESDEKGTDEADSENGTDEVSDDNCPFVCRSANWCAINDGIAHEEYECSEPQQVCCEVGNDVDTEQRGNNENEDTDAHDGSDTGSDSDTEEIPQDTDTLLDDLFSCEYECRGQAWCDTREGITHEDLTCPGVQVCCES